MDEADPRAKLEPFQALIGEWTIEMTHPMVEDTVVRGRATYEWPFVAAGSGRDGLQGLFGSHLLGRGAERLVSVGTTILACTTARTGPDERLSPIFRRVLLMTVTIPSLPRRQVNWWAISAGIVMVGYACIAGVVFVLRGAVGFFVPGASTTRIRRLRSRFLCSSLGQHHLAVREWDESKRMRELVSRCPRGPRSGADVGREVQSSLPARLAEAQHVAGGIAEGAVA